MRSGPACASTADAPATNASPSSASTLASRPAGNSRCMTRPLCCSFTLQHNGRVMHRLLPAGREARVDALLGEAFVAGASAVDAQAGPLRIVGFAVRPAYATQAGGQ